MQATVIGIVALVLGFGIGQTAAKFFLSAFRR